MMMTPLSAADPAAVVVDPNDDLKDGYTSGLDLERGAVYTWHKLNVFNHRPPPNYPIEISAIKSKVNSQKGSGCCNSSKDFLHILKNVSGIMRPGQLVALMGGSGSGKTTLLNALHFESGPLYVEGDRYVNGIPVDASFVSEISGYVHQEDLFFPTLTVREHLIFTARVKMNQDLSFADRITRVDQVIHELGLTKSKGEVIGNPQAGKGISTGELKRLAFASEFLTDPLLLFCDEPISGLDAFVAQNVVEIMKKMTNQGKSIICTIHQPPSEVFDMFDHICLLSEGRVAFQGATLEALSFFDQVGYPCPMNHNPADFFTFTLSVIPGDENSCQERNDKICNAYLLSRKYQEIDTISKNRNTQTKVLARRRRCNVCPTFRASWCVQFDAILRRAFLSIFRDPWICLARLMQTVGMALVIGLVFYQQELDQSGLKNMNGALFMFIMVLTIMNCFGVIFVFCDEMPVILREHWNRMYRMDAYFLAKSVSDLPFIVLSALIFDSIAYYLVGLASGVKNFLWSLLILVMVGDVSASFGYLMSILCKDLIVALAVTPPTLVPIFLFSGFFLRDHATPPFFKWVKYCTWFYFGCETLFVNQWAAIHDISDKESVIKNQSDKNISFGDGDQVLKFFNYEPKYFKQDIIGLLVHVITFRFLAYACLALRAFHKK